MFTILVSTLHKMVGNVVNGQCLREHRGHDLKFGVEVAMAPAVAAVCNQHSLVVQALMQEKPWQLLPAQLIQSVQQVQAVVLQHVAEQKDFLVSFQ